MRYFFKAAFQKAFEDLELPKQTLALKALELIRQYLAEGSTSHGLRVKKIYEGNLFKVCEARAGIDLRLVWFQTRDEIIFALIGSHDDVKRFLKNL